MIREPGLPLYVASLFILFISGAPFLDQGEQEVNYQYECEQYHCCRDQCLSVKSCGISHFQHDICSHGPGSAEDAVRYDRLISYDHGNRQSLAYGTPHAQDDSCRNARLCRRQHRGENAAFMGGSQGQSPFVIAVRHRPDRRFGNGYYCRQYHYAQHYGRGQDALSAGPEDVLHQWYDDHQSEEAVDY